MELIWIHLLLKANLIAYDILGERRSCIMALNRTTPKFKDARFSKMKILSSLPCFPSLYISFPPMGSTSLAYLSSCMFKFISFEELHTHCAFSHILGMFYMLLLLFVTSPTTLIPSFLSRKLPTCHSTLTWNISFSENTSLALPTYTPQTCTLSPTLLCALAPYAFLSLSNWFFCFFFFGIVNTSVAP